LRRDVFIRCGNLVLEGVYEVPDHGEDRKPGALVCHPHPLYGGNLHNNVVRATKNGLLERDFACLRFNFRGTGASDGAYGEGVDELEDVRAALDFLSAAPEVDSGRILVAGYSFGCWVGLRAAAEDLRPSRLVGISPPVDPYDFGFLATEMRPKLLMAGDRDFVCSEDGFIRLGQSVPEPKRIVVLKGADHFHIGREGELVHEIGRFLDAFPW
jgi:uncharacterized protein